MLPLDADIDTAQGGPGICVAGHLGGVYVVQRLDRGLDTIPRRRVIGRFLSAVAAFAAQVEVQAVGVRAQARLLEGALEAAGVALLELEGF